MASIQPLGEGMCSSGPFSTTTAQWNGFFRHTTAGCATLSRNPEEGSRLMPEKTARDDHRLLARYVPALAVSAPSPITHPNACTRRNRRRCCRTGPHGRRRGGRGGLASAGQRPACIPPAAAAQHLSCCHRRYLPTVHHGLRESHCQRWVLLHCPSSYRSTASAALPPWWVHWHVDEANVA